MALQPLLFLRKKNLMGPRIGPHSGIPGLSRSKGSAIDFKQRLIEAAGAKPLVWLNGDNIEHSDGVVTNWKNDVSDFASGGSDYDLNVVDGAPTVEGQQSKLAVRFDGSSDYLRPTAQQSIAQVYTVFLVAQADSVPVANKEVLCGRDTVTAFRLLQHNSGTWRALAGVGLDVTASDDDVNIHAFLGNSTGSAYAVYNTTEEVQGGDAGTSNLEYITMGASVGGTTPWPGWVGELIIIDSNIGLVNIGLVRDLLLSKWAVGPT